MRTTHRFLVAIPFGLFLVHAACSSDDSSSPGTSTSSSGGSSGAASSSGTGSSSGGSSSGTTSSSGGSSSGSSGDSGTAIVSSCAMPVRVDTLRGVSGAEGIGAAAEGDKWAVAWHQGTVVDGQTRWKARVFDGTTLKDEVDLGTEVYGDGTLLVDDGNGHAFSQNDTKRRILDWSTATFEDETTFSPVTGNNDYVALTAIPGGGAISLYRNGSNIVADRWLPGTPTWTATDLAGPNLAFGLRVYANGAGKAIALWYTSSGSDTTASITAFDGTNWGTTQTKLFAAASGGVTSGLEGAILASGDFVLVTQRGATGVLQSYRFHADTGAFDAAVDVGTSVNAQTTKPSIVVDASDRVTIAWLDNGHAKARRDVGAGYLAEQDLGVATVVRLDVDRASSNVAAVTYASPSLHIRALTGTSNAWSSDVTLTGLGVTNLTYRSMVKTVFDGAGKPIVFAVQEAPADAGPGGLELAYAKCQ